MPYFLHISVAETQSREALYCAAIKKKPRDEGVEKKEKGNCWLLMALWMTRDKEMKLLSNALLHHENEAERSERALVLAKVNSSMLILLWKGGKELDNKLS